MPSITTIAAKIESLRSFKRKRREARLAKLAARDLDGGRNRVMAHLEGFPKQREMVVSGSRRLVTHSGRRAGKTDGWAQRLYLTGTEDRAANGLSVFITSSLGRSEKLIGAAIRRMNERHRLGIVRQELHGELYYRLPNKHRIWLAGIKDSSEVDKVRGPSYFGAVVDECQGLTRYLRALVMEALEPALLDNRGWLGLSGTPNLQPVGDWYEFCSAGQYENHHWTVLDNPFIEDPQGFIDDLMRTYGWTMETPKLLREYFGRWTRDTESLCFPWTKERNWVPRLPDLPAGRSWSHTLGVDLGVDEPCAWVVWAHSYGHPVAYVVHAEPPKGMSPSQAGQRTKELRARFNCGRICVDTGGIGAAFVSEWGKRYGFGVTPAKKTDKAGRIATLAGEIEAGNVKTVGDGAKLLEDEWALLPWNDEHDGFDDGFEDHLSDAALYGFDKIMLREETDVASAETVDPEAQGIIDEANRLAAMRGWRYG